MEVRGRGGLHARRPTQQGTERPRPGKPRRVRLRVRIRREGRSRRLRVGARSPGSRPAVRLCDPQRARHRREQLHGRQRAPERPRRRRFLGLEDRLADLLQPPVGIHRVFGPARDCANDLRMGRSDQRGRHESRRNLDRARRRQSHPQVHGTVRRGSHRVRAVGREQVRPHPRSARRHYVPRRLRLPCRRSDASRLLDKSGAVHRTR